MVKKIVVLIFIASTFMLTSCSFGGGRMLANSEEEKADARIEQILSAIKDKDREAVKELFSQKVLDEINMESVTIKKTLLSCLKKLGGREENVIRTLLPFQNQ